jgi:hypothetical protein
MSADSYALRKCLRMIRHCLALAMREESAARLAEFRHRIWIMLARPWMTLIR